MIVSNIVHWIETTKRKEIVLCYERIYRRCIVLIVEYQNSILRYLQALSRYYTVEVYLNTCVICTAFVSVTYMNCIQNYACFCYTGFRLLQTQLFFNTVYDIIKQLHRNLNYSDDIKRP